ncbi:MAG: CAP domain-containing protein, partial [Anaerolineae bacterium]
MKNTVKISVLFSLLAGFLLVARHTAVTRANQNDLIPYAYLPLVLNPNTGPEWLQYLNQFRLLADLSPLTEEAAWSAGGVLHSRYMVENDTITHYEDTGNPWYTTEGYNAGRNGNVAVSSSSTASDESAIDLWMTGPFHAVGIIDPELARTGFGSYRHAVGTWKMGATLDVLRGLES